MPPLNLKFSSSSYPTISILSTCEHEFWCEVEVLVLSD